MQEQPEQPAYDAEPQIPTTGLPDETTDQPPVVVEEVVEPETPPEQPEATTSEQESKPKKQAQPMGFSEKIKHAWRHYWHRKHAKLYTFGGTGLISLILLLLPPTRYFLLNLIGVRSSTSITLFDQTTKQPLKNVQVSVRGITAASDVDGKVKLEHVKLGRAKLTIRRRAFADVDKMVTLGWGSNPMGNMELKPVGTQYKFSVTDFLSNKPVEQAEASSNELSALSDDKGELVLTVDDRDESDLQIAVSAKGYRTEKVTINSNTKEVQKVSLVSGRSQPFISKQSGKYDLYKIDVDGKNETVVLKATGNEQANIGLITHPTDEIAAYVSTRESVRNKEGFLLSTLTLIDLTDNTTKTIAQSERLQVMGWAGTKLVFAQIAAGTSAANAARQKLLAYDYKTQKSEQLATSNSFNDLLLIGRDALYAPSNALTPNAASGLFKITSDNTNKQTIIDKEVWSMFRTDYTTLHLSVGQDWYQYKIGTKDKPTKQSGPPANLVSRVYVDSEDGQNSLWVDERDGKGTLVLYDIKAKKEKVIKAQAGLSGPVRWLDNHTLVYRIHTNDETADYVMNIQGGAAKKIRDVTHTEGAGRWYYY